MNFPALTCYEESLDVQGAVSAAYFDDSFRELQACAPDVFVELIAETGYFSVSDTVETAVNNTCRNRRTVLRSD